MALESFVQLRQFHNGLNQKEYWGTAAPSLSTDVGPWNVGDVVLNSAPSVGSYIGWVCTTAGAAGDSSTWSAFGTVGSDATAADLTKLHAITATAAALNAAVVGAASGYKVARGIATIDAASKDVVTGLATVVAATVSMVGDPSLTHSNSSVTPGDQAGAPAAGSIRVKSWKPTAAGDCTPTAASAPYGNVAWIAIGT